MAAAATNDVDSMEDADEKLSWIGRVAWRPFTQIALLLNVFIERLKS